MLKCAQTGRVVRHLGDRIVGGLGKQYRVLAVSKVEQEDGLVSNAINKSPCEPDNRKCDIDNRKSHNVYTTKTPYRIHINLAELTNDMQDVFCRGYLDELTSVVSDNEIKLIHFNHLAEEVFRYHVNMPIRKLGFTSTFQRYNEDRGLAEFNFIEKK